MKTKRIPNLWNIAKVVIRGNFIVINICIKRRRKILNQ